VKDKVLLFSGGMNSVIAYFYLEKSNLLHFKTDNNQNETNAAVKIATKLIGSTIDITYTCIANDYTKDIVFLSYAAKFANNIYLTSPRGEDKTPTRCGSFFKTMSAILSDCYQIRKNCDPVFKHMTKIDMVAWYLREKHDPQLLLDSYSCLAGEEKPCSTCIECLRKFIALDSNKVKGLENIYNIHKLMNSKVADELISGLLDPYNKHDKKLTRQILDVVKWYRRI
jgi:7-cyano-7-deazaguanine synthase in queuosine biosynthesis